MPSGLKKQLGLGEPQAQGSSEQADKFKAAFQGISSQINEALQYTAAYAQQAKHGPLAAKREKLCTAYQAALGRIDPTNPTVAQGAIDQVLSAANALKSSAESLKAQVEKAYNAWKEKQPLLESITDKITEMVDWGHKKASALQQVLQGITAKTNEKAWEDALKALDQLNSKFTAIYEEYQRQKAAKAKYEELEAKLKPRLDQALSSCSDIEATGPLQQQMTELRTGMETAAQAEDYEKAANLAEELDPKLSEFEKLLAQRDEYEARLAALQPRLDEVSVCQANRQFLQPLQGEMATIQSEMESAAQSQDYAAALEKLTSLEGKVDECFKLIDEKKAAYEAADKSMRPQLDDALVSARAFPSLKGDRSALETAKTAYEKAAADEDYEQAEKLAKELESKAGDYLKKAAKEQEKFDKLGADAMKAMDDANYFTRDDVAREWADKLKNEVVSPGPPPVTAISFLPTNVRNRMMQELQDGVFSDDDKVAMKKLVSEKYLDPEFEKIDKANRAKMIEKLKSDPAFKDARDNWETLKPEERIAIMQKAVDYQADAYGIPKTTIKTYSNNSATDYGYYRHSDGVLYVNAHDAALKDGGFDEAIDTAVHENGHRQQNTLIDKLNAGEIKPGDPLYNQAMTFKLNSTTDGFYVQPPRKKKDINRGPEYFTQPLENHSRITGTAVQNAKIGT